MKLGHIAAVLLAGWILMAPSVDCARDGLQRETPLSEWEQVDSFSSQESCENYRSIVIEAEKSDSGNVYVERYSYSICVQADDPRLKGGVAGKARIRVAFGFARDDTKRRLRSG
jgi:hypothetical protein